MSALLCSSPFLPLHWTVQYMRMEEVQFTFSESNMYADGYDTLRNDLQPYCMPWCIINFDVLELILR